MCLGLKLRSGEVFSLGGRIEVYQELGSVLLVLCIEDARCSVIHSSSLCHIGFLFLFLTAR